MEPPSPNFASRDYYKILDVPQDATQPQITKAYRLLARLYHPDSNQDDPEATVKFQKVSEAYATLGDPEKRAVYNYDSQEGIDDDLENENQTPAQQTDDEAGDEGGTENIPDIGDEEDGRSSGPSMTQQEAERIYEEVFGRAYEQYHHDPGNQFGYAYAEDIFNAFPHRRLADRLTFKIWRFKVSFLLEWLIKCEINKCGATLELLLNWVIILSWFAVIGDLENMVTRGVGGVAMFVNLLLLHSWYGFLRYPSVQSCCLLSSYKREAMSGDFNELRDICSFLLHGDEIRRGQHLQILVTLPATVLNHLAALTASTVCWWLGCCTKYSENSEIVREGNTLVRYTWKTQHHTARENRESSGAIGILAVIVFWPIVFIASPGLAGPSIAVLFFFGNQHLFNSLLFRKSFLEFIIDGVTGNIFAVVDILPKQDRVEVEGGETLDTEDVPTPSENQDKEDGGSGPAIELAPSAREETPRISEPPQEHEETTSNEIEDSEDHSKASSREDLDSDCESNFNGVNSDSKGDDEPYDSNLEESESETKPKKKTETL